MVRLQDSKLTRLRDESLRCPECAYRLRGLASDRCPECGHLLNETLREYAATIRWAERAWRNQIPSVIFLIASLALFGLLSMIRLEILVLDLGIVLSTMGIGLLAMLFIRPGHRSLFLRFWFATVGWLHVPVLLSPFLIFLVVFLVAFADRAASLSDWAGLALFAVTLVLLVGMAALAIGIWWIRWRWMSRLSSSEYLAFLVAAVAGVTLNAGAAIVLIVLVLNQVN